VSSSSELVSVVPSAGAAPPAPPLPPQKKPSGQVNIADIQRAVQNSVPLIFRLAGLLPESFPLLDAILQIYLGELGQEKIQEPLSYCLKELIQNAQKANAKRIYFEERGLQISRKDDYDKGMRDFHKEISENLPHFLQRLKERGMTIEVSFHATGGSLVLSVRNDSAISPMELSRIQERVLRTRTFHSFFEVLESAVDKTEGAGLGIMMLIQFLKRIGLDEKAFAIRSELGRTVASISIPISSVHLDQIRILTDVLVRDIESLPHFPQNVVRLLELTEDTKANIGDISLSIAKDPTLTAELLKHVNSAYYGLPSRVNSIVQAVKMVGMRSLHHLLYSFGYNLLLDRHQARMRLLWEHSLRTAFYAFILARDLKRRKDILDDVYVAGILHDLGFIVVTTLHPKTQERMRRFSVEKNLPPRILERFSFGMNHADIGAMIAEKWRFPEQLIEGIKYHHDPLLARASYKDVVFCVYLANAVCDVERGMITFRQLDRSVLSDFGIGTPEQFAEIASRLKQAYEKRQGQLPAG
jgi:HD-like signal output (HDOD) protein